MRVIYWKDLGEECPVHREDACPEICVEHCEGVPVGIAHIECPVAKKEASG